MRPKRFVQVLAAAAAVAGIFLLGILMSTPRLHARDDDEQKRAHDRDGDEFRRAHEENEAQSRIQIGFEIAPVHLNLSGKNRELVGLGSYLVNSVAGCNDCHSAGPPLTQYLPGGNPFFGQRPKAINPATYLGGGRDFGPPVPGSAHIISRNLTPDKTGMPVGGHSFAEFLVIMREGVDMDHLHPTCIGAPNANCIPPPFDGSLLQNMPWPVFQTMTTHDLRAIYEYLSAIPCVAGPPSGPLHNDCP